MCCAINILFFRTLCIERADVGIARTSGEVLNTALQDIIRECVNLEHIDRLSMQYMLNEVLLSAIHSHAELHTVGMEVSNIYGALSPAVLDKLAVYPSLQKLMCDLNTNGKQRESIIPLLQSGMRLRALQLQTQDIAHYFLSPSTNYSNIHTLILSMDDIRIPDEALTNNFWSFIRNNPRLALVEVTRSCQWGWRELVNAQLGPHQSPIDFTPAAHGLMQPLTPMHHLRLVTSSRWAKVYTLNGPKLVCVSAHLWQQDFMVMSWVLARLAVYASTIQYLSLGCSFQSPVRHIFLLCLRGYSLTAVCLRSIAIL